MSSTPTKSAEQIAHEVKKELAQGKTGAITMNVIDLAKITATRYASQMLDELARRIKEKVLLANAGEEIIDSILSQLKADAC